MQRLIVTVYYDVILRPVLTVYRVFRVHIADVFLSRLQCMWKLTDEWASFMLAYEADLYQTPYVLKIWVVH